MKKVTLFLSLSVLLILSVCTCAAEKESVKIAVASTGKTTTDAVSNLAARCPYYLVFDGMGNLIEAILNPYRDTARGAGPSAANFLAEKSITIVVSENIGIKMINALKGKCINHFEFRGRVEQAVKKVLELK